MHNTNTREATSATVVYSCSIPDLAILKLNKEIGLNHIDTRQLVESASSRNSELCKTIEVIVIGFGLGHSTTSTNPSRSGSLVSRGVVSKVVYDRDQPVMFVTTAALNPGMSGGLVASVKTGRLLGMVVSNSQWVIGVCFSWTIDMLVTQWSNLVELKSLYIKPKCKPDSEVTVYTSPDFLSWLRMWLIQWLFRCYNSPTVLSLRHGRCLSAAAFSFHLLLQGWRKGNVVPKDQLLSSIVMGAPCSGKLHLRWRTLTNAPTSSLGSRGQTLVAATIKLWYLPPKEIYT